MEQVGNSQREILINLKKRLPKEDIGSIFDELYKLVPVDHSTYDTLLIIHSQHNSFESKSINGVLGVDDVVKNENVIREKLINYISKLIKEIPISINENVEKVTDKPSKAAEIELATFTDPRDGQTYKTVELNGLVWMAENLNFDVGKGCWFYNNGKGDKAIGRLYDWESAKKACPPGLRLPTEKEWADLIIDSGGYYDMIIHTETRMKIGDDPERAFDILKEKLKISHVGGYRDSNGEFGNKHIASFWSLDILKDGRRINFNFDNTIGEVVKSASPRLVALSCRCVRGEIKLEIDAKLIPPDKKVITETPRLPFEPEMVFVQGGTFNMGSNDYDSEKPIHEVILQDFHIGKYPVTQAQWNAVMGANPSYFKDCDDCPVERVSWNDVQEFIKKLNEQTGKNYRLPSEAEWEYAARGGNKSKGFKYAGSNNLEEVGWNHGFWGILFSGKTHPVGKKEPNELGIYDMSGNVDEWCADVWHKNYEGAPTDGSAWMSGGDQARRVVRGGSWNYFIEIYCRVSYRSYYYADFRNLDRGFRLAGY